MLHDDPYDHQRQDEKPGDPMPRQQSSAEDSASPPPPPPPPVVGSVDSHHVVSQGDFYGKEPQQCRTLDPDQEYRPEDLSSLETVPSHHPPSSRRICLFGLSADPPTGTGGHVGVVQALVDHTHPRFDEIHVLPVYRHTFADKRDRLVSFEHRLHMCQIAFGHLPRVVVSDAEYQSWKWAVQLLSDEEQRQQVSVGTAALLDYLYDDDDDDDHHQQVGGHDHPGRTVPQYYFCLGADAFLDLTAKKWQESDRILQRLQGRWLVVTRPTASQDDDDHHVEEEEVLLTERVAQIPGAQLLQVPALQAISSSQARACGGDEAALSKLVSPGVLDYIRQHGLYQE